jgi:hypothetical protein
VQIFTLILSYFSMKLEQCRNYDAQNTNNGWLDKLFSSSGDKSNDAVYAPGSVIGKPESGEKVVVAVLGLAHCNGIKKLLISEKNTQRD